MRGRYSIRAVPPDEASELSAAVDSLPTSITRARTLPPQIEVLDGRDPRWAARASAAFASGASAVLVLHPSVPHDSDALDDLIDRRVPLALDLPWARNPAVAALGPELASFGIPRLIAVDGYAATVAIQRSSAVDAVIAIHRFTGTRPELASADASPAGLSLAGWIGQAACRLTFRSVGTGDAGMRLCWYGDDGSLIVQLPGQATSSPARVEITDRFGSRVLPSRYETSLRATLRRVVTALDGGPSLTDASEYRSALAVVATICSHKGTHGERSSTRT